nr:RecName: Full=Peroxidase 4 [Betula pendula]
FYDTTCPK